MFVRSDGGGLHRFMSSVLVLTRTGVMGLQAMSVGNVPELEVDAWGTLFDESCEDFSLVVEDKLPVSDRRGGVTLDDMEALSDCCRNVVDVKTVQDCIFSLTSKMLPDVCRLAFRQQERALCRLQGGSLLCTVNVCVG